MSGVGQLFQLAAQGQEVSSLELMSVHMNLEGTLSLIETALHDDQLDKLVERAEMLVVLAKKHRDEHQKLNKGES